MAQGCACTSDCATIVCSFVAHTETAHASRLVLLKFSSVRFFASVGRTPNQTLGPVRGTWLNPELDLSSGFTTVRFRFRGVVNPEPDVKWEFSVRFWFRRF